MISIFTVVYMVFSLFAADPAIADDDFTHSAVRQALMQNPAILEEILEDKEIWQSNAVVDDYVAELRKLGYFKESGDSGLDLRNAVLHFQSDHNLLVDGVWGPQCNKALIKHILNSSFTYTDTVLNPPSEGKWITINKTNRILTLYEGSSVKKKYPVAVGLPPSLTPSGKFSVYCKVVNPAWGGGGYAKPVAGGLPDNPLGFRWIGLSIGKGDRYGIHGNNKPYSIGRDVSHGCVRMVNSDVEELFEIIGLSAPVWIGDEKELDGWNIRQDEY